jgi:hypothetical protein
MCSGAKTFENEALCFGENAFVKMIEDGVGDQPPVGGGSRPNFMRSSVRTLTESLLPSLACNKIAFASNRCFLLDRTQSTRV